MTTADLLWKEFSLTLQCITACDVLQVLTLKPMGSITNNIKEISLAHIDCERDNVPSVTLKVFMNRPPIWKHCLWALC